MTLHLDNFNFNADFYRSVQTVEQYQGSEAAASWALKLLKYGYEGVEPVLDGPMEEMAWALVQGRLDAMVSGAAGAKKKAAKQVEPSHTEANSSNGKTTTLGSGPKKNHSHTPRQGGQATPLPRVSAKGVAHTPSLQKEKEKEKEYRDIDIPTAREKTPTLADVEAYFTASAVSLPKKVLIEEAAKFFNHFDAQGWVTGAGVPIQRWQAKANVWLGEASARKQRGSFTQAPAASAPSHELAAYDRVDKVVGVSG